MVAPNSTLKLRGEGHDSRTTDNVSAVLNPLAQAVGATPIMGSPPPSWIRADYRSGAAMAATGFLDVAPASVAGATPQQTIFHRDALGYVWMHVAAVTAAGVAGGAAMLTLPQAYRPAQPSTMPAFNATTGALNQLTISVAGVVATVPAVGAGQSVVGYFSFLAEQ